MQILARNIVLSIAFFGIFSGAFAVDLEDLPALNRLLVAHLPMGIQLKRASAQTRVGEFDLKLEFSILPLELTIRAHILGTIREGRDIFNLTHNGVLSAADYERILDEPGLAEIDIEWESDSHRSISAAELVESAKNTGFMENNPWIPGDRKNVSYQRTPSGALKATAVLSLTRDEFMDVHGLVKQLQNKVIPRLNTKRRLDFMEVDYLRNHIFWASGRHRIDSSLIQPKFSCSTALAKHVATLMELNWDGVEEPERHYPFY